jgi:hypothetical protein
MHQCVYFGPKFHIPSSVRLVPQNVRTFEISSLKITFRKINFRSPNNHKNLKRRGKKWRKKREIPHDLTPQQLQKRDELCYRLWRMWRCDQLSLHKIVTHDQSWIFYDSRVCRKQWLNPGEVGDSVPKRNIHRKKQMLCLYWRMAGPLYWELLEPDETFNSDVYAGIWTMFKQFWIKWRQMESGKDRLNFCKITLNPIGHEDRPTMSRKCSAEKCSTIPRIVQMLLHRITMFSCRLRALCVDASSRTVTKSKLHCESILSPRSQNFMREEFESCPSDGLQSTIIVENI